jgi:hypothetical protein
MAVMTILNVNASLDPVHGGGTAKGTVQISRFLAGREDDCTVLTMDLGLTSGRAREMAGVRLVALPCLSERFYVPRTLPATIRRLVADSDVVHLMSHWSVLNALVYASARAGQAVRDLSGGYVADPRVVRRLVPSDPHPAPGLAG